MEATRSVAIKVDRMLNAWVRIVLRRPLLYRQWHACSMKWVMN